jgi:outer membrane autotransporter protein
MVHSGGAAMDNLVIATLNANSAHISMNVDLGNQTGDKLTLGSHAGDATIHLNNIGATAKATSGEGIQMVEYTSGATVSGTFALDGGHYDKGGYIYELQQGTTSGVGNDYYLRATGTYTETFKTMLNIPVMNTMIAQTGMNSLQRRMGDLRGMNNTDAKQGVWARTYVKGMTVKDLAKTDLSLFGAEAGYDWLFMPEEPNKLYAGVMLGFVDASNIKTETKDGAYDKGKGQSPSIGIYATLLNEDGWFVDLAARNFWTKLDMKTHASDGTELAYKPERNVLAMSVEVGKDYKHELARDRFLRIEPKLELGFMNAAKADAEVTNGDGKMEYDATNYVNAKAGVLLGYNAVRDNGLLIEPLVELALRQEFAGKGNVTYAGATEKSNMVGTTVEVSAGLNMELTKDLYWYGLGSYEAGSKEKGWGVYAGIRYAFGK